MDKDIIKTVMDAGYEVWMRDPGDTWLMYTDGVRVASVDQSFMRPPRISTAYKPNKEYGSGFVVVSGDLSPRQLEAGLDLAHKMAREGKVRAWNSWEEFHKDNLSNAGYKRIQPEDI